MVATHAPRGEQYDVTVIEHAAAEGGYWAEVVELPGRASQAETMDEALANVQQTFLGMLRS
jgi:predicted RNase H-like HicB family nuclease